MLLKQVGMNPIVVHGGGPQIGAMLERLKVKSEFIDGLRVTDAATVEVVEMVLSGTINKQIVTSINQAGGKAVGLSGKDANFLTARRVTRTKKDPDSNIERVLDLGFVGEPEHIDPSLLDNFEKSDIIPVIAPIGVGRDGATYNINADTVAGAVAAAMKASRLLLLTDVRGVLDKNKNLLPDLTAAQVRALIADGTISGGMIPKVETCLLAVEGGVEGAIHPRRPGAACHAARDLHRHRRRHDDQGLAGIAPASLRLDARTFAHASRTGRHGGRLVRRFLVPARPAASAAGPARDGAAGKRVPVRHAVYGRFGDRRLSRLRHRPSTL